MSAPTASAGQAQNRYSFGARCLHSAIGFAAFAGTCLCFHAILPEPDVPGISAKLRYFEAHRDEFDTVLIGTSRIQYHISPAIFDATTAALGMPTRTFNLGLAGMHPPESFLLVERFLALKPSKLKWVFLEFEDVQAGWDTEQLGTRRLVHWHNWRLTALAIRKAINRTGDDAWYRSMLRLCSTSVALHLKLFAQKLGNVGAVADLWDSFSRPRDAEAAAPELGPARDGYEPGKEAMSAGEAKVYSDRLARAVKAKERRLIDPYAEAEYRKIAGSLRELGAVPVFLLPPNVEQNPISFRDPPTSPGPIIGFNDAQKYPTFYDPAMRSNRSHLSREGAEIFSRMVAEEFVSVVRAGAVR